MNSIRKKLFVSIMLALAVMTALLSIATYYSLQDELDELYDGNMKQMTEFLAMVDVKDNKSIDIKAVPFKRLRGDREFLIQIWHFNQLQYASHPIAFAQQERTGFSKSFFQNEKWKSYKLVQGNYAIQVSQNIKSRREVIREIYNVLSFPVFLQFPIVIFLIWLSINYGLRSLKRISSLIERRTAFFLEPLPNKNVPVEVSALVGALNDLLGRLQDALTAQRQLTADAAHELRTPLAALKLQLDILKRAHGDEDRRDALEMLEEGVDRSVRLVQQLMQLAHHEPGQMEQSSSEIDLNTIVRDVTEQIKPLADEKRISIQTEHDEKLLVQGNASQLFILINNLVHNAILYSREHGRVQIALRQKDGFVVLDVADNGIGIDPSERNRIFDRFYRVTGTGVTGSGLGLSIVRNIANAHNIRIELDNGLNNTGTTFRLYLPLQNK